MQYNQGKTIHYWTQSLKKSSYNVILQQKIALLNMVYMAAW